MKQYKHININDYTYHLPKDKIALFPCRYRDESKLLVCKQQVVSQTVFKEIDRYLPDDVLLVFNNTRVVHARLLFVKSTGSVVEIFCLEPLLPSALHAEVFKTTQSCVWKCFIGNNKRFTSPLELSFDYKGQQLGWLRAEKTAQTEDNAFCVRFEWTPTLLSFAEVLEYAGKVPLPPYIKRATVYQDDERYQTLFAKEKGSVAAPTAGLHFSSQVLQTLKDKGIPSTYITLHVGAGTFKPVSETWIENHAMHCEQLFFTRQTIEHLLHYDDKKIVAVGTTTARALESLYWIGVKIRHSSLDIAPTDHTVVSLGQWEAYEDLFPHQTSMQQALQSVLDWLTKNELNVLHASTALMITPSYQPKIVKGIITNFHQSQSTLLLLIAAFVGDQWREIYDYALSHDFRFLSYGDACLFLP